jgi:hypothetical protein
MKTIYQRIIENCPSNIVGNHESDLYLIKNRETTQIIKEQREAGEVLNITVFNDKITNELCYDIAFGYDPFWNERLTK